jgi:hypothetical protein
VGGISRDEVPCAWENPAEFSPDSAKNPVVQLHDEQEQIGSAPIGGPGRLSSQTGTLEVRLPLKPETIFAGANKIN